MSLQCFLASIAELLSSSVTSWLTSTLAPQHLLYESCQLHRANLSHSTSLSEADVSFILPKNVANAPERTKKCSRCPPPWKSREIYILLYVQFQRRQGYRTCQPKLMPTEDSKLQCKGGSTVDDPKQVLRDTSTMTYINWFFRLSLMAACLK